ncbi:MAG TPA: hypothetical protein VFZ53_34815 [Polyangiaceae bacterium]
MTRAMVMMFCAGCADDASQPAQGRGGTGGAAAGTESAGGGTSGRGGASAQGGASGTAGTGPGDIAELSEFIGWMARRYCDRLYECCSPSDIANNRFAGRSEDECAAAVEVVLAGYEDSVSLERVGFDGARAAGCIAATATLACEEVRGAQRLLGALECEGAFEPLVPRGGECTQVHECVDGTCDRPVDGGTCVERKVADEECMYDHECASGYCDLSSTTCASEDPREHYCTLT